MDDRELHEQALHDERVRERVDLAALRGEVERLLTKAIAWHEREARACKTTIDRLGTRGGALGAMNEGALKVHRIAVRDMTEVLAALQSKGSDNPLGRYADFTDGECRVALANVSGVLCDAGAVVPADPREYGAVLRAILSAKEGGT